MGKSRPQTLLIEAATKGVVGMQNLVSSGSGSSSLPARTTFIYLICNKSLIHKYCVDHVAWSVEQSVQQKRDTICAMP